VAEVRIMGPGGRVQKVPIRTLVTTGESSASSPRLSEILRVSRSDGDGGEPEAAPRRGIHGSIRAVAARPHPEDGVRFGQSLLEPDIYYVPMASGSAGRVVKGGNILSAADHRASSTSSR